MRKNKGGVNMRYVYRMMSQQEYMDLVAGKTLVNTTVHDAAHTFSYSTGFCFLPWEVSFTWRERWCERLSKKKKTVHAVDKITALQAIDRLLPGPGNYDLWVQLKVLNPKVLKKSKGEYLDFKTDTFVWTREYCTTSYSAKDLQPMHAFSMPKVQDVLFERTWGAY